MKNTDILQTLYYLLPALVALLPGLFKEDWYSPMKNSVISTLCITLGSILAGLLFNHFFMNLVGAVFGILVISILLLTVPMRQLDLWLQTHAHILPQRSTSPQKDTAS